MTVRKLALGIDLGGTNVRFGLLDSMGRLLMTRKAATQAASGQGRLFDRIVNVIREMACQVEEKGEKLEGIGIGAPGPLDARTGSVQTMPNLPGWENFPLKTRMEQTTGYKVVVMNDADAVAWGEYTAGAAKGFKDFVVITLGTGVGSCLFLEGKPWIGADGFSSELGHIPIALDGPVCSCGRKGHLESFVSSRRIAEDIISEVARGGKTIIDLSRLKKNGFHVEAVSDAAYKGDALAVESMRKYGMYLGRGLAVIANLLNLPLAVLCGGIVSAWPVFQRYTMEALHENAFSIQAASMEIRVSRLGDNAGIIGAASRVLVEEML